jgi:hypothetical protein
MSRITQDAVPGHPLSGPSRNICGVASAGTSL